jgi:hypothetical protein
MRSIQITRPPVDSPPRWLYRSIRTVSVASAHRCDCRGGAGRSAAGDQHVAVAEHRHLSRPLDDRVTRAWPTLGKPAGAEHLGLKEHATVIG